MGFRWVKPAASLKRNDVLHLASYKQVSFRWVKPAASLKLDQAQQLDFLGVRVGFPLGKTGGLIEAVIFLNKSINTNQSFRWVKPAASLKLEHADVVGVQGVHVSAG